MMDMPRPRPPYLHRQSARGKTVWYVRRGHGPRIRIRGEFGSDAFNAAYEAALRGEGAETAPRAPRTGSLQWLWERYQETTAWLDLSPATRKQRSNIMAGVVATAGREPYGAIGRGDIEEAKDRRRQTPAQARNFLDAMRGLFRWALNAGLVKVDPTAGVGNPKRPEGQGFPPWSMEDVGRYEARWAAGTRERVWLHVLLYTGLRRGDAVCLGRWQVRNGVATITTEKTGTAVTIPIQAALSATLAEGPCGEATFICGASGQRLTKESFGNLFRDACRAAGVDKSAHGLRKLAATIAAENGATVAELEALFGWSGGTMASLYTRSADRRRLALGAAHKMVARTADEQAIPSQADSRGIEAGKESNIRTLKI
jgi:integrase